MLVLELLVQRLQDAAVDCTHYRTMNCNGTLSALAHSLHPVYLQVAHNCYNRCDCDVDSFDRQHFYQLHMRHQPYSHHCRQCILI